MVTSGSILLHPAVGMTRLSRATLVIGLLLALGGSASAQSGCGGQFGGGTVCANPAGSKGLPGPTIAPVLGVPGTTGGQITFSGSSSGSSILRVAPAAGTGSVFQLPSTNGANTNLLQTDGSGVTSWVAAPTGNVVGPASATDTAIAIYNGTSGKLIKNSLSTVDGTGAIVVPASFAANTGRITVGTGGTLTSQNAAYQDQRTVSTSGTSLHGYAFDINLDAPGGYGVGGFDCRFNTLGSQNYDHINCFQSNITYSSLGTLTNHIGYLHQPHFTAGTVTNNTGLFISNPDLTGGGTLTNNTGIFIDTQTSGSTNLAIQTNGATVSQFGGNVISLTQFEVRNALPEVKLSNAAGTPFSAWFSDGTNVTLKNYIAGSLFFQTNAANVVELSSTLLRPSNDNAVGLGDALHRYTNVNATGYLATGTPVTQTGTTGTVGANDGSIIVNASGPFTETLPVAANFPGRWLHVKSIAAQTIVSASSNVVPLAGGAAGTALLTSGAGKWANLQSDGTNWVVMAGN